MLIMHWQNVFSVSGGHIIKWNLSSANREAFKKNETPLNFNEGGMLRAFCLIL
jgi:hypothetical protein